MLLNIIDGQGFPQTVVAKGNQEAVLDGSGSITATAVAQTLLAASTTRSGFIVQNNGAHNMYINDTGVASSAPAADLASFVLTPGSFFPPSNYPVSSGAISISGTIADNFTLRSW